MKSLKLERINGGLTCCERNKQLALMMGYDMAETNRVYGCDGTQLIIPDGDYTYLSDNEIDKLVDYVPAELGL